MAEISVSVMVKVVMMGFAREVRWFFGQYHRVVPRIDLSRWWCMHSSAFGGLPDVVTPRFARRTHQLTV